LLAELTAELVLATVDTGAESRLLARSGHGLPGVRINISHTNSPVPLATASAVVLDLVEAHIHEATGFHGTFGRLDLCYHFPGGA
jgi:hypothetical protein